MAQPAERIVLIQILRSVDEVLSALERPTGDFAADLRRLKAPHLVDAPRLNFRDISRDISDIPLYIGVEIQIEDGSRHDCAEEATDATSDNGRVRPSIRTRSSPNAAPPVADAGCAKEFRSRSRLTFACAFWRSKSSSSSVIFSFLLLGFFTMSLYDFLINYWRMQSSATKKW